MQRARQNLFPVEKAVELFIWTCCCCCLPHSSWGCLVWSGMAVVVVVLLSVTVACNFPTRFQYLWVTHFFYGQANRIMIYYCEWRPLCTMKTKLNIDHSWRQVQSPDVNLPNFNVLIISSARMHCAKLHASTTYLQGVNKTGCNNA